MTVGANAVVNLIGGTQSCNVFLLHKVLFLLRQL
jgi:hypothetical protein